MTDDTTKKLARIKQLIGMAGSSNEEEARSMAYLACRMIREGGFEVVSAVAPVTIPQPRPAAGEPFREGAGTYVASPFRGRRKGPPLDDPFTNFDQAINDILGRAAAGRSRSHQSFKWVQGTSSLPHTCERCHAKLPAGVQVWSNVYGNECEYRCIGCGPAA